MWTLAANNIRASFGRFLATILAIATGVAFLTAGSMLTDAISRSLGGEVDVQFAAVDAAVVPATSEEGSGGFGSGGGGGVGASSLPDGTLDAVESTPGVAAAAAELVSVTSLLRDGERISSSSFGGDGIVLRAWVDDDALNPLEIVEGRAPRAPGEVAIDRTTALDEDLGVGATLRMSSAERGTSAEVVGVTAYGTIDRIDPNGTVSLTRDWAASLIGVDPGSTSRILIRADDGVDGGRLVAALRESVPGGTEVLTGAELREEEKSASAGFASILSPIVTGFGVLSLLVCAFVISNTFAVVIAQRRRELALLRAVAATPKQVRRALLLEGLLVGLAGSVAGLAVGIGLSFGFAAILEALDLGLPPARLTVDPVTLGIGLAVGTFVTVASVLLPAFRGGRTAPVAAMREAAVEGTQVPRVRTIASLVLLVGGAIAAGVGSQWWLLVPGVFALALGVLGIGPAAAVLAARAGSAAFRHLGVPRRLAAENLGRHPRRTSSTTNALIVGLFLVTVVTVSGTSVKTWAVEEINKLASADVTIVSLTEVPDDLIDQIGALDGVEEVAPLRSVPVSLDGQAAQVAAVDDPQRLARLGIRAAEGSFDRIGDGIAALVIGQQPAVLGQRVPVVLADGSTRELEVTVVLEGTIDAAFVGILASPETVGSLNSETPRVRTALVGTTDARASAIADTIEDLAAPFNVFVISGNFFGQIVGSVFDFLISSVNALLSISVIVALIGIVNTLSLSIFERRRELGLLRAVGMTRREVRRMVRTESVLMAVQGTVLGIGAGTYLSWALMKAADVGGFDVPWARVGLIAMVGIAAGLLASALPTWRVTRLEVVEAMAE